MASLKISGAGCLASSTAQVNPVANAESKSDAEKQRKKRRDKRRRDRKNGKSTVGLPTKGLYNDFQLYAYHHEKLQSIHEICHEICDDMSEAEKNHWEAPSDWTPATVLKSLQVKNMSQPSKPDCWD